ncbi:MAG TPA: hypothetical protein DCG37_01030, partial [Lachnospiraceae bacterium]|nr:hypothetical protein [Lachnospiraceae bacterium]
MNYFRVKRFIAGLGIAVMLVTNTVSHLAPVSVFAAEEEQEEPEEQPEEQVPAEQVQEEIVPGQPAEGIVTPVLSEEEKMKELTAEETELEETDAEEEDEDEDEVKYLTVTLNGEEIGISESSTDVVNIAEGKKAEDQQLINVTYTDRDGREIPVHYVKNISDGEPSGTVYTGGDEGGSYSNFNLEEDADSVALIAHYEQITESSSASSEEEDEVKYLTVTLGGEEISFSESPTDVVSVAEGKKAEDQQLINVTYTDKDGKEIPVHYVKNVSDGEPSGTVYTDGDEDGSYSEFNLEEDADSVALTAHYEEIKEEKEEKKAVDNTIDVYLNGTKVEVGEKPTDIRALAESLASEDEVLKSVSYQDVNGNDRDVRFVKNETVEAESEDESGSESLSEEEKEGESKIRTVYTAAEDAASGNWSTFEIGDAESVNIVAEFEQVKKYKSGRLTESGPDYNIIMYYSEDAEIPEGCHLDVREISAGTEEYEKYLSASLEAIGSDGQSVASARFFDIKILDENDEKVEPSANVSVRIHYSRPSGVTSGDQADVVHIADGSDDADTVGTKRATDSMVSFEAESFSVYGVIYTVDFAYDVDGRTFMYSIEGESSISLRDLLVTLHVVSEDEVDQFLMNIFDVEFSNTDVLRVTPSDGGDWVLESLLPFSTDETLTITMIDGQVFTIQVTDEGSTLESTDLSEFLSNAVVTGATQNSEGRYQVEAGKEYKIILSFAESSEHQFDNHATLTYTMPAGLTILSQQTGDMTVNIVYKGRTYQVDATYDLGTDGNLKIKFVENDPDFHHLEHTTNVSFRFSYNGAFDGSEDEIHFSQDIERDIVFDEPEPGQAYVTKDGTFDEKTGKFTYTITVNATGDVTKVNVKDVISGNALIFNNDVQVSGNSSSYIDNGATNGFDYTFASMREGETITITYSASVDFSKDTDKDGKITVDQTKNTATVKPDGGDPHNSEYSHEISFKTTKKSNGTPDGTTADGDKIYKWTITYNELRLAPVGGDTIKDTIAASSTEYMKYYGDGLSINVIDKNGNIVDTRSVPYNSLQSYSDSSWTYKIPEGDSQPYMYEITYYTVVDMEKVEGIGNTVTVSNDANGSNGSAAVTPESVVSVDKNVDSFTTEEVNWSVTLGVPATGLTQAVVTDTIPSIWLNGGNIYDLLKDGSLQITGLLDGESYSVDTNTAGQVKITFYQDPGKKISGLKGAPGGRTITVKLTTLVDQKWLQAGYETGGYVQTHTNNVNFNGKTAQASVIFGEPGIEKKGDALTDSQGNITGLKYTVVLKGVSETPVSVLDAFDTSILEVDASKATSWDHMRIWGGDQWSQDAGRMPVSYTDTGDGIILTADSVPMQADGNYYPYYKIIYYLKVKDGVDLKALAIVNGGEYDVDNTVNWGDHESEFTYKVEYDYLDKKLLNKGELGGTNRTAKYQITFNPSKATLNEGSDMTMTDVLSANLSVEYGSISIVTEPAGQSVRYSLSGGEGGTTVATYIIPDSTKVTITYDASVRGNGSQKIVNKVSVNGKDKTIENTKSYGSASEGEGAQASFKIVKVDGYDASIKLQGVKFKVFCENPNLDFNNGGGLKELTLVTDENGEITFDGNAYTFYFDEVYHVQELEAPENYGKISFDYLVTLTNDMAKVDYDHYIYYYSDSMQIKNWPLEGLVVEKQVESDDAADKDRYYTFRVSILNEDGSVNTGYNEKNGDDQFENGVVEFQIKDKEQKMFWGFAKGTKYLVEELDAAGFVTTVTYSVFDADGNVIEIKTETGTSHSGSLTQEEEVIVFKNSKTDETGSLKVKKNVTVNGEATTGTSADGTYTFTVTGPNGYKSEQTITITNGESNEVQVDDLVPGTYTVSEDVDENPEGMSLTGENDLEVEVKAGEEAEVETAEFTNNLVTTTKQGTKIWSGDLERPTIWLKLYEERVSGEGEQTQHEIDAVNGAEIKKLEYGTTTATWEGLPKYYADGTEITYIVREVDEHGNSFVPDGYVKIEEGMTVTNTPSTEYNPRTSYIGTKSWQDTGHEDERPESITVKLYQDSDGNDTDDWVLTDYEPDWTKPEGSNEWTFEFGNLPVFSDSGVVIKYTAEETVTDKYTGEKTDITPVSYSLAPPTDTVHVHTCSDRSFSLSTHYDLGFVIVKLTNQDFLVWTQRETTADEKTAIDAVGAKEFGDYKNKHHSYVSGLPYRYNGGDATISMSGQNIILSFSKPNVWDHFAYGTFKADYTPASNNFKNTIKEGSLKIRKNVTVNGAPTTGTSADGTYSFTVKDSKGVTKATETITITNGVSGEAVVSGLIPGSYTVIEDTALNPEGMSLVGENNIEVVIAADSTTEVPTAEFTNNCSTVEGEVKAKKTLSGRDWTADDSFEFTISAAEGTPMPENTTVTVTKDSTDYTESFGTITFTEAGTYTYTITETHKGETIDGV